MKVIFDTVVLVRGLIDPFSWSGTLLFARASDYEWVVSPEIVAEYLEVISRPRLMKKYLVVENRDPRAMLARIEKATLVHPNTGSRRLSRSFGRQVSSGSRD